MWRRRTRRGIALPVAGIIDGYNQRQRRGGDVRQLRMRPVKGITRGKQEGARDEDDGTPWQIWDQGRWRGYLRLRGGR